IRLAGGLSLDAPAIRNKPRNFAATSGQRDNARARTQPKQHAQRNSPIRQPLVRLLARSLRCMLPALGALRLGGQGNHWPLFAYLLSSVLAFGFYMHDKRSALRSGWRTPEARLHLVELLGGWPGALIAQQALRHKTRKLSFQMVFWLIVIAHQVVWFGYLYLQRLYRLLPQF